MNRIIPVKTMSCEDFYTCVGYDAIDALIQEMYWDGGCNQKKLFQRLKTLAKERYVNLGDAEEFDYEKFFTQVYDETEKGLS